MKSYQEIELYLYFLKLEGNYCMVRQLWKLANIRARNAKSKYPIVSATKILATMYTKIQKIRLINELTRVCAAMLIVDMDEQDRQIIFGHIQDVVNRMQILLNDLQPRM